jgi:hypothetical protein
MSGVTRRRCRFVQDYFEPIHDGTRGARGVAEALFLKQQLYCVRLFQGFGQPTEPGRARSFLVVTALPGESFAPSRYLEKRLGVVAEPLGDGCDAPAIERPSDQASASVVDRVGQLG